MNRTRVSVLAAGLAAAAMLSACGFDREATIDDYMKEAEKQGIVVDRACVEGVFSRYSDDELESNLQEITTESALECAGGGSSEEAPAEEAPEEGS